MGATTSAKCSIRVEADLISKKAKYTATCTYGRFEGERAKPEERLGKCKCKLTVSATGEVTFDNIMKEFKTHERQQWRITDY